MSLSRIIVMVFSLFSSLELEEGSVRLQLTIIETKGYGDQLNMVDRYVSALRLSTAVCRIEYTRLIRVGMVVATSDV